ncbi:MAG: nitroreductase family protein, partial [Planctomycetota bacterium]
LHVAHATQHHHSLTVLHRLVGVALGHLAAASAYVQNFLLLLTAAGLESYWASANLLDSPPVKSRLGIPAGRKLLGAIMVGYPLEGTSALERAGGGNHTKRSPAEAWSRELSQLR